MLTVEQVTLVVYPAPGRLQDVWELAEWIRDHLPEDVVVPENDGVWTAAKIVLGERDAILLTVEAPGLVQAEDALRAALADCPYGVESTHVKLPGEEFPHGDP